MTEPHSTSMFVLERGASAAGWCAAMVKRHGPGVHVLAQGEDEADGQFAVRVRRRLKALSDEGRAPASVTLIANPTRAADALTARALLVRTLAFELARSNGGVLHLDGAGDRLPLVALADAMQEVAGGGPVVVGSDRLENQAA